mgnify:CR=1 FL=1
MKLDPRACSQLLRASNPIRLFGKVNKVVGLVAEGGGLRAPLGAVCHMLPDGESEGIAAEVVGFRDGNLLFMPYGDMRGIRPGSLIRNTSLPPVFPVGPELLGRAFDAFGTPLDAGPPVSAEIYTSPLPAGDRGQADFQRQLEIQAPFTPEWAINGQSPVASRADPHLRRPAQPVAASAHYGHPGRGRALHQQPADPGQGTARGHYRPVPAWANPRSWA